MDPNVDTDKLSDSEREQIQLYLQRKLTPEESREVEELIAERRDCFRYHQQELLKQIKAANEGSESN